LRGDGVLDVGPAIKGLTDMNSVTQRVRQGGINMPPMQTLLTPEQIRDVSYFVVSGLK